MTQAQKIAGLVDLLEGSPQVLNYARNIATAIVSGPHNHCAATLSSLLVFVGIYPNGGGTGSGDLEPWVPALAFDLENRRGWTQVPVGPVIAKGDVGVVLASATTHHIYLVINADDSTNPVIADNQGDGRRIGPSGAATGESKMFVRSRVLRTGLVLAAIAAPIAALASHGKVGLWEVTTHMNMPNMMANIPPDELAKMQAMGVHMPNGQTYTSRQCMTAAQVAEDKPPAMRNAHDCAMTNVAHDGHHFTADVKCSGEMQGTGHTSVTYDSDEHYSGTYSFHGMEQGNPQSMTMSSEGKWISADCGATK